MTPLLSRRSFVSGLAAVSTSGLRAQSSAANGSIVVPFTAGFLADILARKFNQSLADVAGTSRVVENITGAGGLVAARAVLNRPADGRTLLWAHSGLICNAPLLSKASIDFDPVADLVPVSIPFYTRFVLFSAAGYAASSLQELRQLAQSRSEPLTYVAADTGSANHVAMELLAQRLGLRTTFVPNRNLQQSFIDVAEGRVDLGVFGWSSVGPLAGSGRAKVLAVLADKPLTTEPRFPTVAAQGFGSFDVQGWMGLFVAKDTPQPLVLQLDKHVEAVLQQRAFVDFALGSGQEVNYRASAESREFVASEVRRYRATLQALKLI